MCEVDIYKKDNSTASYNAKYFYVFMCNQNDDDD